MKSFLLGLALVALVASAAAGSWQDLFIMDCNGGMRFAPSLGLVDLKMHVPSLTRSYKAFYDLMYDRVSCKCPSVTTEQFERLFMPSVAFGLNVLNGPNADISMPSGCSHADFANSSMTAFRWNYTANAYRPIISVPFALPSTCSYNTWITSGECKLQWALPASMSMNLEFIVKKCPNSHVPFMSLSCSGSACNTAMMPCNDATECGTGMKCTAIQSSSTNTLISSADVVNVLNAFQLTDTCRSPAQIITPFYNLVRKFFDGHTVTHGSSELRICLPQGAPTTPGIPFQQVSDAFIPPDACSIKNYQTCYETSIWSLNETSGQYEYMPYTSCYNTTMSIDCATPTNAALRPWNGIMSTGESAASSTRMVGTAAPAQMPRALTPGAKIVMYSDCATSEMHLLPSSNFLSIYGSLKSTADMVNTLWSSLRTSANCATSNTINDDTFRVKFGAMWDFVLYYLTKPAGTAIQTISQGWSMSNSGFFNVPSTCTYEKWRTTGSCSGKFTGLSDLFGVETVLQFRTRKCPAVGPNAIPETYIECIGAGCSVLDSIKPCSSNTDCVNGLVCQDLTALWQKMGIQSDIFADIFWPTWGNTDGGSCRSVTKAYETLRKIVLTATANDISSTSSSKVCMHSVSHISSIVNTWTNGLTTTDAGVTTLKGLLAWDAPTGDISIGSPLPTATLTVTVTATTAPTQAELDEIAKRIALVFGLDISVIKVTFNPKKRANFDIVIEFYAGQVVGAIASVSTDTTLRNSITAAITETSSSLQVQNIAAAVTPTDTGAAPGVPPTSAPVGGSVMNIASLVSILVAVLAVVILL